MADNREYERLATGIYETFSHDGKKEYLATFRCNSQRFNKKNLTKLFNATTLTQAKIALGDAKAEIRKGNNPFTKHVYKREKKFIDYMREISDSKKGAYRTNINVFVDKHLKPLHNKRLEDISRQDILDIMKKLEEQGYSNSYLNNTKKYVGFVYNEAMKNGIIDKSPVQFITAKAKVQRDIRELTSDKLKTAQEFCREIQKIENFKYRIYFLMVLFTCRRMGELLKLKWDDIDLEKNLILSRAEITKAKRIQEWALPKELLILLKQLKELFPKDTYIFQSDFVTKVSMGKHLAPINKSLVGFEKKKFIHNIKSLKGQDFHTHDFRHLGASLMIDLDIHPYVIQAILSHKNTEITGTYARTTYEKTLSALEKLYEHITTPS